MTRIRHYIAPLLAPILTLCSLPALAQLTGSVNVEGEYLPLIIETERVNTFPQGYRFDLPRANLNYEVEGIVTDFRPDLLTMGVTGRQTGWPWKKYRGFVDFNIGSYLNTHLHAGYYALADPRNTLLAQVKYQSSSLFKPTGLPVTYTPSPYRRLYDGGLSLQYTRLMAKEGMLNANVGYDLNYFNYYGTTVEKNTLPPGENRIKIPTQTVNNLQAGVSYASSPSLIKGWHAGASLNYLAYRHKDKETDLKLEGGYAFGFKETSAVAIDADTRFLFYSKGGDSRSRNYGIINLTPSYRLASTLLTLKAGLNLTVSYDAMGTAPGKKFGALHLSPDIEFSYNNRKGIGISVAATGGVTPSTLMLRRELDRYQAPELISTLPIYSPLDARLAINIGPFAGFSGDVSLRYAIANNTPIGGWYQYCLGTWFPRLTSLNLADFSDPYLQTVNLRGYSVGLNLNYAYGTMVGASLNGEFSPQNGKEGVFNGYDRPRWVVSAKIFGRPIKPLKLELGYEYRGVRSCYAWNRTDGAKTLTAYRLPDITDLNFRITYSIMDNLDIYCQGLNLLNRHPWLLPGLQTEGIAISGGLYFEF